MSDDLVPELHDIGKLVDWNSIKRIISEELKIDNLKQVSSHSFVLKDTTTDQRVDYLRDVFGVDEPEGRTWKIINYHHREKIPKELKERLKGDEDLLLIGLADHRGSAVSRMLQKKEKKEDMDENNENKRSGGKKHRVCLHKLWNPDKDIEAKLISDKNKFKELITFIKDYPSIKDDEKGYERYFAKYGEALSFCPEDSSELLNVTSLLTHSSLVGKFYRFFEKNKNLLKTRKGKKLVSYTTPKEAEENIEVLFLHGKVRFHINPVRARDLNVFNDLEKFVNKISELDEVVFHTPDEFLAFLPPSTDLYEFWGNYLKECLSIEFEGVKCVIEDAFPTPRAVKLKKLNNELHNKKSYEKRDNSVYKSLVGKIKIDHDHHICDLCQMYEATKEFPRDYVYEHLCEKCRTAVRNEEYPFPLDKLCESCKNKNEKWLEETISENLCIHCFNLREKEPRAPKIVEWSESDEDFKVAWVKISLDIEELQRILEKLYEEYLKKKEFEKSREGEIRFSVLSEFQSDFENFLGDLMRKREDNGEIEGLLADKFGIANCQWILSDLFCIRIESLADITEILKIYNKLFDEYFPKFKKVASPIKLSISCSSIKFAFFWHWRFLDNPVNDVNVNLVGKGEMHLNLEQLDNILKLNEISVPQLRKLSKVSEVSKELSKILLYHKGEWRLVKKEDYEKLKKFASAVGFENILTYAKMISEEEQLVE
ncbi:MAG: hypothetical protein KBONHNOK_01054 [Candidatus Methanoperedenaceae archaeon GB50]|nr:MAG: hypothetical protein KBONHNOK_01054 [Candidatus Methanoperedenaceae archaeon GB50]